MTFTRRALLAITLITLTLRSIASAGGFSHAVHPDAISWWRFDPSRFSSTEKAPAERRVFLATIRAAIASGLLGDGTSAKIIEGVLAASDVGAVPHTLSLFDFEARRPPSGVGIDISDLRMVLELHTGENHEHYMRTVRAIVVDAERAKSGKQTKEIERQRVIDLPDGSQAVAFSLEGWPSWREISWTSRGDSFVIALGEGAMARRFTAAPHEAKPAWAEHEAIVDDARPRGHVFFTAYLDIDHLRASFPEAFERGRTPRMTNALGLEHAARLMLHGRFVESPGGLPPMLAIDATTADRDSGVVTRHAATLDTWPTGEIPVPPLGGSYLIASKLDWHAFAQSLLDFNRATIMDHDLWRYERKEREWREAFGERFDASIDQLAPWLVISDDPTPLVPIPGLSTLVIPLDADAEPDAFKSEMAALLEPWSHIVTPSAGGLWTLSIHESGLVRFPTWSVTTANGRSVIAAGWGPQVIRRVNEVLERANPR
ncbi:MAG: hypothetical protein RLN60_05515 [Phycisphaerales bacterium]